MKYNEASIFNIDENGVLTGLCSEIRIPEGVTRINSGFYLAEGLNSYDFITDVHIPATCEEIEDGFIKNCKTFLKKFLKNYQSYPVYYKTYHPCYPQSAYNRDSCPFPRLALLFYGSSCCDTWKVEQ